MALVYRWHCRRTGPGFDVEKHDHYLGVIGLVKVAELFAPARKQAQCMIFFGELAAMVPNSGVNNVGRRHTSEVSKFHGS